MKIDPRLLISVACLAAQLGCMDASWARGVSPYVPLNVSPRIERQIERVLILAGKPVTRRPIAAATVLDALPRACKRDAVLCEEVKAYLQTYMESAAVTHAIAEVAAVDGEGVTLPNSHGRSSDSAYALTATAYAQLGDHVLLNVGGVVDSKVATPAGTYLSIGNDVAQFDIGYRDHWFSPLTDSSMTISSQAPAMPAVTLSNYTPISPLNIGYEVFFARMSRQDNIRYYDQYTSGNPSLTGIHLDIEPFKGVTIGINRLMQYGGGARGGSSLSQFLDALTKNSNQPDEGAVSEEFGNQVASIVGSITFDGRVPLVTRFEYAGEDNAYEGPLRLGDTAWSWGIDVPKLWRQLDLTYEVSEWQNVWYTHHLYPDGLENRGHVIGHWFGDDRAKNDAIGGDSQMIRMGWLSKHDAYWQLRYRRLHYDNSWRPYNVSGIEYATAQEVELRYARQYWGRDMAAAVLLGRDVYGGSYVRLSGSVDLALRRTATERMEAGSTIHPGPDDAIEMFVDLGVQRSSLTKIFITDELKAQLPAENGYHWGVGIRRAISKHADIGVRLERDNIDGGDLWSLRALDYRYRLGRHLAIGGFLGIGRYNVRLPAVGYYLGLGLQYRNILPKWDVGIDFKTYDKLGRDKVFKDDQTTAYATPPRNYYDIRGIALYISRNF